MHRARITRTNGKLSIELPDAVAANLRLSEGDSLDLDDSHGDIPLIVWRAPTGDGDTSEVSEDRVARIEQIIERRRAMLESLAQR